MSLTELKKKKTCCFQVQYQTAPDNLAEQLQNKEKISVADEAWLDNDGNHVEEDTIYKLENSSDYGHALSRLDKKEADMIERPKGFAEGLGKKIEKVADTGL
ncbi:hypothetical protein B0H14DRAFT_2565887 [Mycena olivaceomarginata]|nr:hypothetical protein B0H14DRAFT_2565887 [Mycena olivaceomarginata]